jgi:hypothetical protein
MLKSKEKIMLGGDHLFDNEYPKNLTPTQHMIRRTWVQSSAHGNGASSIPHWFPSAVQNRSPTQEANIRRKVPMYNRTDRLYYSMLEILPNKNKHGLEIRSDIGRSTGFFATVTDKITILEDAIEWVELYDVQTRNIARRLGKKKACKLDWCFASGNNNNDNNNIGSERIYDWIKIEFDAMHLIHKALEVIKPNGVIICVGTNDHIKDWQNASWAKDLDLVSEEKRHAKWTRNSKSGRSTSYLYFSINTNGETQ